MGLTTRIGLCALVVLYLQMVVTAAGTTPSSFANDIAISTASVLLPPDSAVYFEIEAYNGCFKWHEQGLGIVNFTSLDPCGRTLRVRGGSDRKSIAAQSAAASNKDGAVVSPDRLSSLLVAEDTASGRTLRCEVFFDQINRVEILTTTRSLYRDDLEILQVQAFDSQGNLFSSLEGLEFQWTLMPEIVSLDAVTVLKLMPFKDSGIDATPVLLKMEEQGKLSSSVLVQASDTGKVKVTAKLTDSKFSHVSHTTVTLSVLEPLELVPGLPIYATPHTSFQYTLFTTFRRTRKAIDMPNSMYRWSSTNTVAAVVNEVGLVTTKDIGMTLIHAQYISMEDNTAKGVVHVVRPFSLAIKIVPKVVPEGMSPQSTLYLIEGVEYTLEVEVFDEDNHRIDRVDDCLFAVTLSVEYFTVSHRTKNNGIHHVLPTKEGVVDVTVTLEKVGNDKLGYLTNFKPITVTEEVVIAKRVRIIPDLTKLLLPYDPEARHSYQLAAEGGSRQYIWSSSNSSTVSVNAQGMVVSHRPGTATIKVADERDPYNRDQIDVVVAVPKVITFANGPREAEVDTSLVLAITMYDNDASGQTFHNCSALPLTWNISIAEIFANPVQVPCSTFPGGAPPKACACASVVALKEGQARAHVTYLGFGPEVDINNLPSKEERELLHKTLPERTASITANTQIAAFRGLRVSPPSILVTFGASYPLSVSGGPQPWQYQQTLSPLIRPEKTSSVEVAHPTNPSGLVGGPSLFPITCLKLDEQVIHVSVGNPASFSNMQPVKVTRNVLFRCENPHKLFVFPNLRDGVVAERGDIANDVIITSTSSCAEGEIPDLRTLHTLAKEDRFRVLPTKYKLRNNRSVPFNLTIFNENGHLFDNFTSLLVDWHISNESLVTFAPTTDPLEAKTHRILNLAALEGVVRIRVSIRGYDHSVIGKLNAPAFPEYLKLTQEFELTLSHNVRFDPPQISLYNHPLNKINLVTLSGSGYNQISVNDSSIASVNATVGDSNIIVIPRHPGVLRITATDICLTGSDLASAIVRVSDIHSINLKAADMVKVGDREIMEVEILDSMGNPFDASQHRFIEYKIHVEGTALEVEKDKETKLQIIGRHVGVSTVSVSVTNIVSGVLVSSLPLQVHVYPNLRVWPRKLELLPNATFQLTTSGGPPFRSEISYQIEDVEIASVSNNGFVTARKIGSSTIKVSAYLTDASGFNKRVVDFGLVELEVKLLRGIRVHASTTRVLVGEEITLRVEGLDGETPFAWGNLNVQFHWDVLNPEVLSLLPVYEKANVSLDEERGFSVRVRGKAPGLTRISVKVEHGPESMHLQTASITFEVVQVLALAGSEIGEGFRSWQAQRSLLLAPGARYRLSPNVPQVRYTLIDHCASVAISSESDREVDIGQVVDLDPKNPGLIQSNGVAGHAIIHAKERRDGQVALIKVSVKPVHHLELRARTPVYSNLPVGTIMEFDIVLRDELGQEFDSYDGVEFEFYMNNQASLSSEIVRTNSTHRHQLRVKGLRPGKVFMLLKVSSFGQATDATRYDGSFQRNLQHFQFLEVSNAILPWLPALHVGAEVTFSTSFIPDKSYRRIWSSDNEAIIKIDAETGVAVAGAVPGSAFVKHQSSVFTGTTVTVARVSFVELNSDSCVVLSQERNVTCVIGVRFFDASRNELRDIAGVIRQNINYQCATNFPALVKAEPFFDSSTNTFGCKLISLERGDRLETIPDKIVLRVTALSGQQNVVGEQVVTFATSFAIQGHGSQINIPSGQATYRIDIKSSSPLRAHSRDSTRLTVREVDFNSATFTHTFEFMVLDPSTPFASIAVEFAARDTNQVETVYVSYARGSRRPSESGWVYPIVSIITIGSVALCAIYFTYSYMMSTQTPARPEERPQPVSSPLGATPRLPLPSPAAFQHNQVNSPFVPIHRRSDYIAPLSPPRTPYGGGY